MTFKEFIGWNPKHLSQVGETYWQHLWWTVKSFFHLVFVATVGLVHGILPFIFADTPDRLALPWVKKFRARRQLTGQADIRPE